MFDVPIAATQYWLGLAVVSLVVLGVATDLPRQSPPDATAAANTVDALAASEYAGTATHPVAATSVRLHSHSIGLRSDAGTTHGTFAFGPVTPAPDASALAAVARGAPPSRHFESPAGLAAAAADAREDARADVAWRPAPDELVVRRVNWGDVRVTLVLA